MIIETLRSWKDYIAQLHALIFTGLTLMRELAGNDPVKIHRVEEWKAAVTKVIAEQSVKDGGDVESLSRY